MNEIASLISLHRATGMPWDMLRTTTRSDRVLLLKAVESLNDG